MTQLQKLFESLQNRKIVMTDELSVFCNDTAINEYCHGRHAWSWDNTHMIVGTCPEDIEIVEINQE